jgi:hypothetical protein
MLRFLGFRRTLRVFRRLSGPNPSSGAPRERHIRPPAETIAHVVEAVTRHHPLRSNCLSQSLVLWSLLRRCGVESHLRIGVGKQAGVFEAHAWVEHRGRILGSGEDSCRQFSALDHPVSLET